MHSKTSLFLIFLFGYGWSGFSQEFLCNADFGLGTFAMKDLKKYQQSVIPDLPVQVKSISEFPPYIGYGFSMVRFSKAGLGLGISGDFYSTGGRNYYEDYSGYYCFDLLTHAFNLGTVFSYKTNLGKHLIGFLEIQQGIKFSTMELNEKLVVQEPLYDETLNLVNTSWWIRPDMRIEYAFTKMIMAGILIGVEINPGGNLHLKDKSDAYLAFPSGDKVTINWSGLRFALSFSLNLASRTDNRNQKTE